jgi:hypothetical protein
MAVVNNTTARISNTGNRCFIAELGSSADIAARDLSEQGLIIYCFRRDAQISLDEAVGITCGAAVFEG